MVLCDNVLVMPHVDVNGTKGTLAFPPSFPLTDLPGVVYIGDLAVTVMLAGGSGSASTTIANICIQSGSPLRPNHNPFHPYSCHSCRFQLTMSP